MWGRDEIQAEGARSRRRNNSLTLQYLHAPVRRRATMNNDRFYRQENCICFKGMLC